jgi:ankyrin repeat protein
VTHKSNQNVYIGVNDSDMLGLTPLMIAAITKNTKAMEKLVKNGADASICPLTLNSKIVKTSIEESKYGGKVMFKK